MPSLQEVYDRAVKRAGEDSRSAKAIKLQMEAEAANQGQSAERIFMGGVGQKLQEMND